MDQRSDGDAQHRGAEVLFVILGKILHFRLEHGGADRAGFKASQAFIHVREKALLALLAVGRNIDSALHLLAHNLRDCAPNAAA